MTRGFLRGPLVFPILVSGLVALPKLGDCESGWGTVHNILDNCKNY